MSLLDSAIAAGLVAGVNSEGMLTLVDCLSRDARKTAVKMMDLRSTRHLCTGWWRWWYYKDEVILPHVVALCPRQSPEYPDRKPVDFCFGDDDTGSGQGFQFMS